MRTMRLRRPSWPNAIIFVLIAGAMMGLIYLVGQTIEAEREERLQAVVTSEVIEELQRVRTAALQGETGQRGFLVTLDRRYLESYQEGSEQIGPALDRLREVLGDDLSARRETLLDEIEALARAKFAEMEASVILLEDGRLLEAREGVLTDQGQETMERLSRAIDELIDIEREILNDQQEETARIEGRILPMLGGLIFLLLAAIGFGSMVVARATRAETEAKQAAAIGEARDRADLLARELNHRVKNLFAVVLAIIQMSARDKPEAQPVTEAIAHRVRALLTAHEVSQGQLDETLASLQALVETTLSPYRSADQPATVEGPEVLIPAKQITPLGLILHELTTNAVKYGAWASGGTIDVTWARIEDIVRLIWQESGATIAEEPERRGFGSMLLDSAARQLGGSVERDFTPTGLKVVIDLPHAASATNLAGGSAQP